MFFSPPKTQTQEEEEEEEEEKVTEGKREKDSEHKNGTADKKTKQWLLGLIKTIPWKRIERSDVKLTSNQ